MGHNGIYGIRSTGLYISVSTLAGRLYLSCVTKIWREVKHL